MKPWKKLHNICNPPAASCMFSLQALYEAYFPFVLKRAVFQKLNIALAINNCCDVFQSGFPPHHTERKSRSQQTPTYDQTSGNLGGTFWHSADGFESHLKYRDYFVSIGNYTSESTKMTCGVPQRSMLGPLLFNIHMLPLMQMMENSKISYRSYAYGKQIYIMTSPGDYGSRKTLSKCIEQTNHQMCQNILKLNKDITEIVVLEPNK